MLQSLSTTYPKVNYALQKTDNSFRFLEISYSPENEWFPFNTKKTYVFFPLLFSLSLYRLVYL